MTSTAVAQNQFKTEVDTARPLARQYQSGSRAADGVAVNADGGEARCDQPAHFEIAEADDGWVELFMDWWEYAIRSWRKRASPDAVLTFLCELGPPPYAITGPDGAELSDRWQDALVMKDMIGRYGSASSRRLRTRRRAPLRKAEAARKMKEAASRSDLFGTTKPAISDDDATSRGDALGLIRHA